MQRNAPDTSKNYLHINTLDIPNYKRSVLNLDDIAIYQRFKKSRELANMTLEDAASRSYISIEDLRQLEEAGEFSTDKISSDQLACLAYLYDVDLYWLLCGKVRPPAAVIQDGTKVYPPYEFMLEPTMRSAQSMPSEIIKQPEYDDSLTDDEIELLKKYSVLTIEGKKWAHHIVKSYLEETQNLYSSRHLGDRHKRGGIA